MSLNREEKVKLIEAINLLNLPDKKQLKQKITDDGAVIYISDIYSKKINGKLAGKHEKTLED